MNPTTDFYLGYTDAERANSPYAAFFNPVMQPLPEHVREALASLRSGRLPEN